MQKSCLGDHNLEVATYGCPALSMNFPKVNTAVTQAEMLITVFCPKSLVEKEHWGKKFRS